MRLTIDAVILNRNNCDDTQKAIESLREGTLPPRQILLVDNASEDDSLAQLRAAFTGASDVVCIANPVNQGFARGNNIGIERALREGADAVFIFNNDATVAPDCLEQLSNTLWSSSSVGIAAPRIFFHKQTQRVWQGGGYFRAWKTGPVTPEKNRLEPDLSREERDVTFLSGCALLIKRDVFEAIGPLSPDYFIYDEDVDFCLRALRADFILRYVPAAKAWHKIEDVAGDRTNSFVFYNLARSRMVFARKNFSKAYFVYALLVHLGVFTPFRMIQWARGSRSPGAPQAWFRGTWAGITDPLN